MSYVICHMCHGQIISCFSTWIGSYTRPTWDGWPWQVYYVLTMAHMFTLLWKVHSTRCHNKSNCSLFWRNCLVLMRDFPVKFGLFLVLTAEVVVVGLPTADQLSKLPDMCKSSTCVPLHPAMNWEMATVQCRQIERGSTEHLDPNFCTWFLGLVELFELYWTVWTVNSSKVR